MQILMPQLILGKLIFSALMRFYLFIFCLFSQIVHHIQVEMHKKMGKVGKIKIQSNTNRRGA